jgi:hypothetical protein
LISLQERNWQLPNPEVHKEKHNYRTNLVVISSNSQQTTLDIKKLGTPCTHLQHYKKPKKKKQSKENTKQSVKVGPRGGELSLF